MHGQAQSHDRAGPLLSRDHVFVHALYRRMAIELRFAAVVLRSQVIADNEAGLLFKNKRDRKVINVDPKARPGDNSRRIELHTHEYTQVVLYDHVTRRKT